MGTLCLGALGATGTLCLGASVKVNPGAMGTLWSHGMLFWKPWLKSFLGWFVRSHVEPRGGATGTLRSHGDALFGNIDELQEPQGRFWGNLG